jgi:hypothetical protein
VPALRPQGLVLGPGARQSGRLPRHRRRPQRAGTRRVPDGPLRPHRRPDRPRGRPGRLPDGQAGPQGRPARRRVAADRAAGRRRSRPLPAGHGRGGRPQAGRPPARAGVRAATGWPWACAGSWSGSAGPPACWWWWPAPTGRASRRWPTPSPSAARPCSGAGPGSTGGPACCPGRGRWSAASRATRPPRTPALRPGTVGGPARLLLARLPGRRLAQGQAGAGPQRAGGDGAGLVGPGRRPAALPAPGVPGAGPRLGALLPRPDLTLVLETPPGRLRERKAELRTAELARQSAAWRQVLPPAVRHRRLDASRPFQGVLDEAAEEVMELLEARTLARLGAGWAGLPSRRSPRWLVPRGPGDTAGSSLAIYQPMKPQSRVGWEAARLLAAAGGLRLLPRGDGPPRAVRAAWPRTCRPGPPWPWPGSSTPAASAGWPWSWTATGPAWPWPRSGPTRRPPRSCGARPRPSTPWGRFCRRRCRRPRSWPASPGCCWRPPPSGPAGARGGWSRRSPTPWAPSTGPGRARTARRPGPPTATSPPGTCCVRPTAGS